MWWCAALAVLNIWYCTKIKLGEMATQLSTACRRSQNGKIIQRYFRSPSLGVNWNEHKKSNEAGIHQQEPKSSLKLLSYRKYHATTKKEILPLIAVGVGVIGVYSFKALRRMDEDWEEYQENLKEYNLEHGIKDGDDKDSNTYSDDSTTTTKAAKRKKTTFNKANTFKGGTLAIDLGTLNVRIAHKPSKADSKPSVIANREGKRATPNHILFETDGSFVTGQLASSKQYERSLSSSPVVNPGQMLRNSEDGTDPGIRNHMIQQVILACAKDALEQAVGRKTITSENIFSLDSSHGYNVQPVFVYPPERGSNSDDILGEYKEALRNLSVPNSIATFVAEPLCAVHGAKFHSLLPNCTPGPVMVIDVGASTTSMSIVEGSEVNYHSRLSGFGGESLVEAVMNYLSKTFYKQNYADVSDKMAVQRLYDAAKDAVLEISSGSKQNLGRVQINIPYLSMDAKMKPMHLDLGVSAKVLEAEFKDMVAKEVVPKFAMKQDVLSQSAQNPSDLSSLFASMIMQVMEKTGQSPFSLNSILIVGGGARSPLIQRAIKDAVGSLAGQRFVEEKLVLPRDELIEELVVLGAALQ